MHHYLKSVGFNNADPVKLPELLREEIFFNSEDVTKVSYGEYYFVQRERGFSSHPDFDFGLFTRGFRHGRDASGGFVKPYLKGREVSAYADITMERDVDGETYKAVFEYENKNSGLIFEVLNALEILNAERENRLTGITGIKLSALSNGGTIILPIKKSKELEKKKGSINERRKKLIAAARLGDAQAASMIVMEDMENFNRAKKKLKTFDLYSVVESSLIPKGLVNGDYNILGEIEDYSIIKNSLTGEDIYILKVQVNELLIDVAVPVNEVIGIIDRGRRFKGDIHLQGCIVLPKQN